MNTYLLSGISILLALSVNVSACSTDYETLGTVMVPGMNLEPEIEDPEETVTRNSDFIHICNFDNTEATVKAVNCLFETADDPVRGGKCGKAILNKCGTSDCVQIVLDRPLDFTLNDAKISFKLYGPKSDVEIRCKLSSSYSKDYDLNPAILSAQAHKSGQWEEFSFDWSEQKPQSNVYNTITIVFNYGKENKTMGEEWLFDDVTIPNYDLSAISLFKRVSNHAAPKPSDSGNEQLNWMNNSTANPQILTPEESDNEHWWLYMRGADGTKGQIGVYSQKKETFNPLGPWTLENNGNPIIPLGFNGTADAFTTIDPAVVKADNSNTYYMFYKGLAIDIDASTGKRHPSILTAKSTDCINFQPIQGVWKDGAGVADAVFANGKYYLFVSRRVYEAANPESGDDAIEHKDIIPLGGVYDSNNIALNFDRYSINGQKVTRIDDKWFMFYQCSPCHDDFPDRIHVAYSDDLIHWTKVQNATPLFTRGKRHSWDEGAIWAPEVFQHGDNLYMYYEGWGLKKKNETDTVPNRDKKYFSGGHSEIGVSVCKKSDFLEWCGLK